MPGRGPASAATSSTGCRTTLADWEKAKPVVIFSHNPLYEYYPPWNFWVRDWRDVHEVLKPYTKVTNIHGHVHQVLYNEIGTMRSIGMLATSWPWPYAPEGVPKLTKPMIRVDPGDHFDGVGWEKITVNPGNRSTKTTSNTSCGAARRSSFSRRPTTTKALRRSCGRASPTICIPTKGGMAMTTISTFLLILRRSCVVGAIVGAAVLVGPANANKDPVTPSS